MFSSQSEASESSYRGILSIPKAPRFLPLSAYDVDVFCLQSFLPFYDTEFDTLTIL